MIIITNYQEEAHENLNIITWEKMLVYDCEQIPCV